jgi:K+-transporting ATPase ATPase A chain
MGHIQTPELLQILLYLLVLFPLGWVMAGPLAHIYGDSVPRGLSFLRPLEKATYKIADIDETSPQDWKAYLSSLLVFHGVGIVLLFAILRLQHLLPGNPQGFAAMNPYLALNTAISFVTNTNWQAYSGEAALSYFSQAVGLTVQNFLSAATGMALIAALARGLRNRENPVLGNFWQDLTRGTIYILLPLSFVFALVLVSQGVVQNLAPYLEVTTLEGTKQLLPGGPAASQIAIKQLGTNGGGFFGVNSAHPFENPTPFSNFWQMIAILLLPVASVFAFGRLIKDTRHARSIFIAMSVLFVPLLVAALWAESRGNPLLGGIPFLEGKEMRFGIGASTLWATLTTAASNGSVNAMHDSLSPLGGLVALFNIMLSEVVFGGVGSGLYGMVLFVVIAVFLAGLMVGRSPEYLGKKIESREVMWAAIGVLAPCFLLLAFSAWAATSPLGLTTLSNQGPHGLTEILYGYASTVGNNGSAFAGLGADTPFYNLSFAFCMLIGRLLPIISVMIIAGSLASKKSAPESAGSFPTHGTLFAVILASVVVIVGALTFFPALALGPIAEHLLLLQGKSF